MHIDIRLEFPNGEIIPIELKYKTRKLDNSTVENAYGKKEDCIITSLSSRSKARYDYLKDIHRIE